MKYPIQNNIKDCLSHITDEYLPAYTRTIKSKFLNGDQMAQEITNIIWVISSLVYCFTYSPGDHRTKKSLAADICW